MPKHTMHVISHTHWDREWYLPFQRFRLRLVDLMDGLLDTLDKDKSFLHFNLDGQTIVLEDYLEVRPEERKRLEKHIKNGRILVGPWYQQNDEFLVSGESTIRSLLVGHRISRDFGATMKIGYVPDQFGHISQLPQIFAGFDIKHAIFGRGLVLMDDRKMEFYWESPDGSKVLSSFMGLWYNNAQRFPQKAADAAGYALHIKDAMKAKSTVGHLLFMNGVDHLEAQYDIGKIIGRTNKKLSGDKLVHSTLPDYMDAVEEEVKRKKIKLGTVSGELREDHGGNVLAGTLSSRIYLKQANENCQTLLEKYAEPFSTVAGRMGAKNDHGLLHYAWKLLMQNHPHDSICGCSVDQVHAEMMPRFDQVEQVAKEVTQRSCGYIADNIATEAESLVVFNPLSWERTDKVETEIDFELGDHVRVGPQADPSRMVHHIRILDDNGKEVPFSLVRSETIAKQILRPDELPMVVATRRFKVEFVARDVPACGYKTFSVEPVDTPPDYEGRLTAETAWDNAIGNDDIRLSLNGGTICVERLTDDPALPISDAFLNMHVFEDTGDIGDEYNYIRPQNNLTVLSADSNPQVSLVDRNPVSATFKLDMVLKIPKGPQQDGRGRSDETVDMPITSYFTVTDGVPRIDVVTEVENRADNHRLRVLFPSGIATDVCYAEGQFDVVERAIGDAKKWFKGATFSPQQGWVDVCDEERGLCVINKGLPEYEVHEDDATTIGLTLLRCVGNLSGGYSEGADMPGAELTPGAQCHGKHRFEYAIYPHTGTWLEAKVWQQAVGHNCPMLCVQTDAHDGTLAKTGSFITISDENVQLSAVKKAEDLQTTVVRLFNPTEKNAKKVKVTLSGAESASVLNMNEEVCEELKISRGTVTIDVPAKKIITLGFA